MKKTHILPFFILIFILFSNCTKEESNILKKVTIDGVILGEKTLHVIPIETSEFGVETNWQVAFSDDGVVTGFFCEKEIGYSSTEDDFEKLIINIEKTYNISFSPNAETENYKDYIAQMNETTSFVYRRYKSTYWNGAVIGIFDKSKYTNNINDDLMHVVFKIGKLGVKFNISDKELSDVGADFVINDSNGKAVFSNHIKPIQVMNGISVTLPLGTYIVNYNHSKYSGPDHHPGKTFAVLDTIIVSKDGFNHESLNFKNAYYSLCLNIKDVYSLEKIAIGFTENDRGTFWEWNWVGYSDWKYHGTIFFNGYDPYSVKNLDEFKFIRIEYKDPITHFQKSLQIDYQKYELNKTYMEFDFKPSTGIIRKM